MSLTIKMGTGYHIWDACDDGDRIILNYVCISQDDGKAYAVAANGFILAGITVDVEDDRAEKDDVLIPGWWLKEVARAVKKANLSQIILSVEDGEEGNELVWCQIPGGERRMVQAGTGKFPDWRTLRANGPEKAVPHLAFNTDLLMRLGRILGVAKGDGLRLRLHGEKAPIDVALVTDPQVWGVLMPMFVRWDED